MLGSAIPKRWVVSLALVGLVSLFMASYAAVWSDSASATTTTTTVAATSTPVPTSTPPSSGSVLSDLLAPASLSLQANQVVSLSASPVDDNGSVNLSLPSVTYTWSSGSCGSLSSTTSRSTIFTAVGTSCTGTITVHANQSGGNIPSGGRSISVSVSAPAATPLPTVVPTDPAVVPVIVPAGLSASDVSVILPSTGGSFAVPQAAGDTGAAIAISIPSGALDSGTAAAVNIVVISTDDVPPPPVGATEGATSGTFRFGSTIIDVQWYDDTGAALGTFKLNRPAQVCVPFNAADLSGADGGPDGMAVWRYTGTEWVQLNSSVNISAGTVCASTSSFSSFALGLAVAAPEAADAEVTTGLPVTGDYTPGVSSLLLAMLAGFALVGVGLFTARRARRVRATS